MLQASSSDRVRFVDQEMIDLFEKRHQNKTLVSKFHKQ
jgi:hypothetical protein